MSLMTLEELMKNCKKKPEIYYQYLRLRFGDGVSGLGSGVAQNMSQVSLFPNLAGTGTFYLVPVAAASGSTAGAATSSATGASISAAGFSALAGFSFAGGALSRPSTQPCGGS